MRREQVPPVDGFVPEMTPVASGAASPATMPADVYARRAPLLQRALRTLVSTPALAIMSCTVVALWVFWNSERIASFLNARASESVTVPRLGILDGLSGSITMLTEVLAGGDMMVLVGIYGAVTLAILALTGYMTMRFVRD
jgi:hypothetical protein